MPAMRADDAARLLGLATIWGSSFLFIKVALGEMTPVQIVTGRLVLGAAVLWALLAPRGRSGLTALSEWRPLLVMAVVANVLPFALITWGEQAISSGLAAVLNATTPLFTAALAAALVPDEKLNALRAAGILVGFGGVAVIVGAEPEATELAGQLAVVVASLLYAAGFIYARRRITGRRHSPVELSAVQLSLASAVVFPIAVWDTALRPPDLTLAATASVAALGMLGTGIAYILLYRLLNDVGPISASFVTYLLPIYGVVLGWVVLDERLGWNSLVGGLLVIGGIALAEAGARRTQRAPVPTASEPGKG